MPASTSDKITRVSDSDTGRPVIAQLIGGGKALGATTISINDATNWTTTTKIHFAIYTTTVTNGKTIKDTTTQTEWTGTLSGTAISNLTLTGGTDQTYLAGSYVELTPTSKYAKDLYDGLLITHNADGSQKDGSITTSKIVDANVTTAKIADTNVTTAKLADNAVTAQKLDTAALTLGYAQITANIQHSLATPQLATGLSKTVTIPSGGRFIQVSAFIPWISVSSGTYVLISLWDGVVGSGTQVQSWQTKVADSTVTQGVYISTPPLSVAAGSKTYNLGYTSGTTTTIQINASATSPAYIHIEAK